MVGADDVGGEPPYAASVVGVSIRRARGAPVDGSTAARAYRSSRPIFSNALLSLPPGSTYRCRLEGEGACPTVPPSPFPGRLSCAPRSHARARARARATSERVNERASAYTIRPLSYVRKRWFFYCCGLDQAARVTAEGIYIARRGQFFIHGSSPEISARFTVQLWGEGRGVNIGKRRARLEGRGRRRGRER